MPDELIPGEDFFHNDEGYIVFTEIYHLKKGYCCGNGCKHCPYHYENVPEPARSKLLSLRQDEKDQSRN